ncbi:carboxylesterase [Chryseomicrobium excrementi]|uniref:Carboxylesterase n=1 Tax=Chryseomicrobium excrementi TaxID=2041346 RepID=A0A2M9EYH9_9BACL|nr:alpha/beta hydrolase [Chryseomicrobium excrementi]PJK16262.1 carboxylesterase [Chryseomicrobium excrementi]
MKHIFKKGTDPKAPTLLLLHGTGGNEHDLLSIASMIDEEASVLSVRGNVLENGMPRFFKRLAMGVLDQEDLAFRTKELHEFLDQAATDYGFDRNQVVAVGYSNGANIAANLVMTEANSLSGAILYHPMIPNPDATIPELSGLPVFIGAGVNDQMVPYTESEGLKAMLSEHGAEVEMHVEPYGHQLTGSEVDASKSWYLRHFKQHS